jgi:hypothetical protein
LKHRFVIVLVNKDNRSDIKTLLSRAAAESAITIQLDDMKDYMGTFFLTIEERWSLK